MPTFQHFLAKGSRVIVIIPNGIGRYIIGTREHNAKRIEELSGARIKFNLRRSPHSAMIYGEPSECKQAKALIEESIDRFMSRPIFGFFLLAVDDIDKFKDVRYRFVESDDDNENIMDKRIDMPKYRIERIREPGNGGDANELDILEGENLVSKLYPTRHVLESRSFGTLDELDECLKKIFTCLNNPSAISCKTGSQIRFHIFFGHQTFFKVDPHAIYSVDDFCRLKRCSEDFGTLFVHNVPQIYENIEIIRERFKLKSDDSDKDNRSISIIYKENNQRNKIKLRWSEEEGLWKIVRVVKNMKRQAIISIMSGNKAPDLRLMIKTKCEIYISPKLKQIIKDLQTKRLVPDENGMWFKLTDFEGKLDCICVRQKINKNYYSNDRFKIVVVTEAQEVRGYDCVTTETNVSLKNLCWRQNNQSVYKSTKMGFDDGATSINETIRFAREVASQSVKI